MQNFRSRILDGLNLRSKRIGLLFTLMTVVAVSGVLGYLVYREWDVLITYQWKIYPFPIFLAVSIYLFSVVLASYNWGNIMNHLGARQKYLKHLQYFSIANAARRLPGTVWYIASRATLYRQEGVGIKLTSMASALEFAFLTLAGIFATLIFSLPILTIYRVNPIFLVIFLVITLTLIHPRVVKYFFGLLNINSNQLHFRDILQWTTLYVLQWVVGGIWLFIVIRIIYPLPIQHMGYVLGSWIVVIMVSRLMIFLPSNLGVTEIGLSLLLSNLMPTPIAVISALLFRLLITMLDITVALVWILYSEEIHGLLTKKD